MFSKNNIPLNFNVNLEGEIKQINPTLSTGRVRIFYKGMNRNRTFISEDFANQLIASLPYTPVKGIFNKDALDYEDHGENNADGRIYGVVAAEPNFAWENHLDDDGVVRTYACADVLYFTGLYPEASLINGKSQSMEIYRDTLKGEWRISKEDGQPYYYFMRGNLLGLQTLGDFVEPCFEGSAFFSRLKGIDEIINYVKNINTKEAVNMENLNVSLEETNNNVTEVIDETQCAAAPINEVIPETENSTTEQPVVETEQPVVETEQTVEVELNNEVISEPTNEIEQTSEIAQNDGAAAQGSFENLKNEYETAKASWENEKAQYEIKIKELENENSSFNERINQLEAEKIGLNNTVSDIKNENEKLIAYKNSVEENEKKAILAKYEQYLSEDTINEFTENMSKYSVNDFKKEVCTAAVESDNSIFSNKENKPTVFFKGDTSMDKSEESGMERILHKYKNGGNK